MEKEFTIVARGDEIEMLTDALEYIPMQREDILSLIIYLRDSFDA